MDRLGWRRTKVTNAVSPPWRWAGALVFLGGSALDLAQLVPRSAGPVHAVSIAMDDMTEFIIVRCADGRKAKLTSETLDLMRHVPSNQGNESENLRNDFGVWTEEQLPPRLEKS